MDDINKLDRSQKAYISKKFREIEVRNGERDFKATRRISAAVCSLVTGENMLKRKTRSCAVEKDTEQKNKQAKSSEMENKASKDDREPPKGLKPSTSGSSFNETI